MSKKAFAISHILFPLLTGAILYIWLRPDTYIARFGYLLLGCSPCLPKEGSFLTYFCCNYLCDILWAYSLSGALLILEGQRKYRLCGNLAWGMGILFELLQKWDFLPGTYDLWDIIWEGIAVTGAILIQRKILRGEAYEKENNKRNSGDAGALHIFSDSGGKWKCRK